VSARNDGGPAFPSQPLNSQGDPICAAIEGMTLRDYFAARALQGELASQDEGKEYDEEDDPDELAGWCYAMADAMLRARGEP
jgi:hypothetical protein